MDVIGFMNTKIKKKHIYIFIFTLENHYLFQFSDTAFRICIYLKKTNTVYIFVSKQTFSS